MLRVTLGFIFLCVSGPLTADSFYEIVHGHRYLCTQDDEPSTGCEVLGGRVYCPGSGETCSVLGGNVYCGYSCDVLGGNVYCANSSRESCEVLGGNVYCGEACKVLGGSVYCTSGGLASPASPAQPRP
ncbi:MAG: hypothetical protein NTV34_16370 [Proteobacteria bacterium]|nr:hypothetical protein [Pseudomonadota bacterium]